MASRGIRACSVVTVHALRVACRGLACSVGAPFRGAPFGVATLSHGSPRIVNDFSEIFFGPALLSPFRGTAFFRRGLAPSPSPSPCLPVDDAGGLPEGLRRASRRPAAATPPRPACRLPCLPPACRLAAACLAACRLPPAAASPAAVSRRLPPACRLPRVSSRVYRARIWFRLPMPPG